MYIIHIYGIYIHEYLYIEDVKMTTPALVAILRAEIEESLGNYNVVFKGAGVDGDGGMGGEVST